MESLPHNSNTIAIGAAVLAVVLYALSIPVSKHLLQTVAPTMAAAFHFVCGQNKRNRLGMYAESLTDEETQ